MAITTKDALKAVYDYLKDISEASDIDYFPNFSTEEIQRAEDQDFIVTLSRYMFNDDPILPATTKEFKYFKVSKDSGSVEWMKRSID